MNCTEVQRLLSAYHDDELSGDRQSQVTEHRLREHLEHCQRCTADLAWFEKLSTLAHDLETPTPPAAIWDQLEVELSRGIVVHSSGTSRTPSVRDLRVWVLAATVLVAVGLGWLAYGTWVGHGDHHAIAADFGHYLEEFRRDPDQAQRMLVAKYDGEAVDPAKAIKLVGYQPVTSNRPNEEYEVKSTHVLKMPCCTCVQTVCERRDGSTVVIFEHDDENTEWFGDRRETMANCSGRRCRMFDLDDRIAASWKSGTRHVTVIGVRDAGEVTKLVAWLEDDQKDNS